jgi:hypothetical protein
MKKLIVLCAVLFCIAAAPMFAGNNDPGNGSTKCSGVISKLKISTNVQVQAGQTCTLDSVEVLGNMAVEGTLIAANSKFDKTLNVSATGTSTLNWSEVVGATSVDGTLVSFSSWFDSNVNVTGTVRFNNNYNNPLIGGSLSITNSSGQSGVFGDNVLIGGNVSVSGLHDGGSFSFSSNTVVNGGVSITNNFGRVDIAYTSIVQSLNCSGNNPAPTSWSIDHGYGPTVSAAGGVTGGQCSDLVH